ncbi:MAG: adenosylmethionine-8-amino-7-oxononanoate aminotransferase [Polaribacter sp.]
MYYSVCVIITREEIYDAFLSNEMSKGFFHSFYFGNPIACSAANAAIELLQTDEI